MDWLKVLKSGWFWIHGLLGAVIGGVATSIGTMIVDPLTFNLAEGLPNLINVIKVSAIISGALYLKKSPLPPTE